jgi:hypothetical protein
VRPLWWSAQATPALRPRLTPVLVAAAQWQAQRRSWAARRSLAAREAQVMQQLSFSRLG